MRQNDLFSIRQMIELTGLSEFTIRGWENRYSAFQPQRSATGRRAYSKSDVERALLLRELLKRGHKIRAIATLNGQKLKKLFEQAEAHTQTSKVSYSSDLISKAMELVALQKWTELKDLIRNVPIKNTRHLIQNFFLPSIKALTSNVDSRIVSISQEHIFSSFLKEKIYEAISKIESKRAANTSQRKVQFVLATPEGDYHEMGLLLAHLLIRSYGLTSLYLGPHTPARDLAESALRFNASHILIVSTVSKKGGANQELLSFVSEVQTKIGSHLQILIAGSQAPLITNDVNSSLFNIGNFEELENYIERIGAKS